MPTRAGIRCLEAPTSRLVTSACRAGGRIIRRDTASAILAVSSVSSADEDSFKTKVVRLTIDGVYSVIYPERMGS